MPGLTLAIAAALGTGFAQIGTKLLDEGVIKPATQPASDQLKKLVGTGFEEAKNDAALQKAIRTVFTDLGIPTDGIDAYIYKLGFDKLQVKENTALREEIARAALLQVTPDVALVPDDLIQALRLPYDSHPLLANFLYQLRQALHDHPEYGPLIAYSREDAVQTHLRGIAEHTAQMERYLQLVLKAQEISTETDAEALKRYIEHVASRSTISFLFIKPAGRRDRLKAEAELDLIFVPLQVQDPQERLADDPRGKKRRQKELMGGLAPDEKERQTWLTIDAVLPRHPVFLLQGKPGCGKTTLLRYLALTFARGRAPLDLAWSGPPLLPILIPLRNFARFWQDNRATYTNPLPQVLRHFIEDYFKEYDLGLPPDFFHQRLKQGNCLLLLDGLDEVADRDQRAAVAQVLNRFIVEYGKKGNRFALASRPRGYEEVADYLPKPVVCDVQEMMPDSRDRLVRNLLAQFETQPKQLREECQNLLHQINSKQKVDELSRNPLFCTTLVLVYKYRGATLPERRVDVYQELIELMLGFWDKLRGGREDTADVRELALMSGTGKIFTDEMEAVEFKRRALTALADWMQTEVKKDIAPKEATLQKLATHFASREGADPAVITAWAEGFLHVAHMRSGLFIEIDPDTYAFAHKNFREYLAATALVRQTDKKMLQAVLAHAGDSWWEEVILLASAHDALSEERRELLLTALLEAGHLVLAGQCAVDAGTRLPAPLREQIKNQLYAQMIDGQRKPPERYEAGLQLDALKWLPPDLNEWVRCPACADNRQDLFVQKYPVTNQQFELFIKAGGYDNPTWWGGEKSTAWLWRMKEHPESRGQEPVSEPRFWQSDDFGRARRGFPVVGVSWYEAMAYAVWLTDLLRRARAQDETLTVEERQLIEPLRETGGQTITLPTETEWVRLAGGDAANRYPWDKPGQPVTTDVAEITRRANVAEGGIGKTSPVSMFPQGASHPFALMDVAGNVWEWTNSWWDEKQGRRVVRGGSWNYSHWSARVGFRLDHYPVNSNYNIGFRLVSPIGSGS